MRFLRLTVICFLLGILAATAPLALQSRGIALPLPFIGGLDLDRFGPPVSQRSAATAPVVRKLRESSTADMTSWTRPTRYSPDPTQGTRYKTESGVVWWGTGPRTGSPRPVIVLMHGAGRTGHSMVDMWYETAQAENLILVAPNFDRVPGWSEGLPDIRAALAALAQAQTIHPIDPNQIFLFGHSRGGIAAQLWANRFDGPWRALAVHGGTLPAQLARPVDEGIPIRHYLGSVDHIFPYGPGRDSAAALARAGHPFDLVRLELHTHWFYDIGEDIAAHAWTWFANLPDETL